MSDLSSSSSCPQTIDEQQHKQELIRILLHVFAPLLQRLSDALRCAASETLTDAARSCQGDAAFPAAPQGVAVTSPASLRQGSSSSSRSSVMGGGTALLAASQASSPNASLLDAEHCGDGDAQFDQASSPPSPLNATRAFESQRSTEDSTPRSTEDVITATVSPFPSSPQLSAELAEGEKSVGIAGSASSLIGKKKRGRRGLPGRKAPRGVPPAVTQACVDSSSSPQHQRTEEERADTLWTFCVPNAVLWEAVAALAESVLMDGACFCWLRDATVLTMADDSKVLGGFSGDGFVAQCDDRHSFGNNTQSGGQQGKPPSKVLCECLTNLSAHAHAELVLLFRKSAIASVTSSSSSASQTQQDRCPPCLDPSLSASVFPLAAAALVRCVAAQTAHLLSPLSGGAGHLSVHDGSCVSHSSALLHQRTLSFTSSAEIDTQGTADHVLHCIKAHTHLSAQPPTSFRELQQELKRGRRPASNFGSVPPSPSLSASTTGAARRSPSSRPPPRARAAPPASQDETMGGGTGDAAAAALTCARARAEAAAESDDSCFALVLHARGDGGERLSRFGFNSSSSSSGGGGGREHDHSRSLAEALVAGGAVVLTSQSGCVALALLCPLAEALQSSAADGEGVEQTTRRPSDAEITGDTPTVEYVPRQVKSDLSVLEEKSASSYDCLHETLMEWCAGLEASTRVCGSAESTRRSAESMKEFTSAAAQLHTALGVRTAKVYAEQRLTHMTDRLKTEQETASTTLVKVEGSEESGGDQLPMTEPQPPHHPTLPLWAIRPTDSDDQPALCSSFSDADAAPRHPAPYPPPKRSRLEENPTDGVMWWRLPDARRDTSRLPASAASPPHNDPSDLQSSSSLLLPLLPRDCRPPTPAVAEALSQVGAVLAAVDVAGAGRTLVGPTSWRYGRNCFNAAAVSFVSVDPPANARRDSHRSDQAVESGRGRRGRAPKAFSSSPVKDCSSAGKGGGAEAQGEGKGETIAVYHHESGLLHLADGSTHAMEIE